MPGGSVLRTPAPLSEGQGGLSSPRGGIPPPHHSDVPPRDRRAAGGPAQEVTSEAPWLRRGALQRSRTETKGAGALPALTVPRSGPSRCSARPGPARPVSVPARRRSPPCSRLPAPRPRMWRSGRSGTLLLTLRGRRGRRRGAAGGSRPGKWPRWFCPSSPLTVRPGLGAERDRAGVCCGRLLCCAARQSAALSPGSQGSEALVGAGTCSGKAVPKSV